MAERASRAPALIASVALHAAILGSTLIAWPWGDKPRPVEMTPVTLLTAADVARLSAAEQSDVPETAQTPAPVADAPPALAVETPSPQPELAAAPKPAPAQPAPQPKPAPSLKPQAPAKPAPATSPAVRKPQPRTVDEIAAMLAAEAARKPTGSPRASGDPDKLAKLAAEFDARRAEGTARASTNRGLGQIRERLIRLWNPNCGVENADSVRFTVRMRLNRDGSLSDRPVVMEYRHIDFSNAGSMRQIDPTVAAAVARAVSAVSRGAPYDNLPKEDYDYWKVVDLPFDPKTACR